MKNTRWRIVTAIIFVVLALWFTDFLPKQVANAVAASYMSKQENGQNYKLKEVEYSPAHDCYFVYFSDKENPNAETRNIGIYYRYLPINVYFDSAYPG